MVFSLLFIRGKERCNLLDFTIAFNWKDIDSNKDDEANDTPDNAVDALDPEFHNHGNTRQFHGNTDRPISPVDPANTETKRWIGKARRKMSKASSNRNQCGHFTEAHHHAEYEKTKDGTVVKRKGIELEIIKKSSVHSAVVHSLGDLKKFETVNCLLG